MAGFQLTLYGRIWVTPKGNDQILANSSKNGQSQIPHIQPLAQYPKKWIHSINWPSFQIRAVFLAAKVRALITRPETLSCRCYPPVG